MRTRTGYQHAGTTTADDGKESAHQHRAARRHCTRGGVLAATAVATAGLAAGVTAERCGPPADVHLLVGAALLLPVVPLHSDAGEDHRSHTVPCRRRRAQRRHRSHGI